MPRPSRSPKQRRGRLELRRARAPANSAENRTGRAPKPPPARPAPASTAATPAPTEVQNGRAAAASRSGGRTAMSGQSCDTSLPRGLSGRTGEPASAPFGDGIERKERIIARPRPDYRKAPVRNEHFRDQQPTVVGRAHHRAIGSRCSEGKKVAFGKRRQFAVDRKGVAGFAHRPDNVRRCERSAGRGEPNRDDVVPGLVKRRTDQIVHRGIYDDETPGAAPLDVEHLRDE